MAIGSYGELVPLCLRYLNDEPARAAVAQRGFELIKRRDLREILRRVLAGQAS